MAGYGKDPFGTGPYGSLGGVMVLPLYPLLGGYGGGMYGLGPYGSLGGAGSPLTPITSGYGGCAYGTGPYGCVDSLGAPPEVVSAVSITGYIIEVFFSHEMSPDADLFDPASYILTGLVGAAPVVVLNVEEGVTGVWGPTSVLLHHTGTTLGGYYRIVVSGPRDIGGTPLSAYAPLNEAELLTKGEPPPFTITPISGSELLYEFEYDMLDEAGFTPGILQLDAYGYTTDYPQSLVPTAVEHPYLGDLKQVKVDVLGMTSTEYTGIVSPATAIEYDGTTIPSAGTGFTAQEVGIGSSTQGVGAVLMNCAVGFSYGWRFLDTSGKLVSNSSYRTDFTFDVSQASLTPVLGDTELLLFLVSDGAVQVAITLKRIAGADTVEVSSGLFFASSPIAWSLGATTISLVRNQKADTFTVVVNGEPFVSGVTASFTGAPGIPNGCQVLINPTGFYSIQDFPLQGVRVTASQTVFSAAWNFLHNQDDDFVGDASNTKSFALTHCGPLVKGWGDATPATKQNVGISINGVPVEIQTVNPYVGKIFPVIPIPLMPPGFMSVELNYIWFPSPVVEFAGLNTEGLVLNKSNNRPLCNDRVVGTGWSSGPLLPHGGWSAPVGYRFPMNVVLGPRKTTKPLLRSPRFIGFQKAYTAALNSPTTLLLNRDPNRTSLPPESEAPVGEVVFYDGVENPTESDPPWTLVGQNDSLVEVVPEGVFPIVDASSGSYNFGDVAFYTRAINTSFSSTVLEVSRFYIDREALDADGLTLFQPDGVFTGVAFGANVNNFLYVVGALLINGVQHIGMLVDPAFPEKQESWSLAFSVPLQILTSTTFKVTTTDLPEFLQGDLLCEISFQIQIFLDPQAGTYTVVAVKHLGDGTSIVTIDAANPFPGNPKQWGGAFFTGVFESEWDGGDTKSPTTYRLVIVNDIKGTPKGQAQLFIGGKLRGQALQLAGLPAFAIPPDGVLLFPTGDEGSVFFGSIDRRATSLSYWSFSHYGIEPAATTIYFRGIVAAAEMNSLPENDPNNIWFLTQEFGTRAIDSTGGNLLLKSTSGVDGMLVEQVDYQGSTETLGEPTTEIVQLNPDLTVGYARIEPFLTRKLAIDLDSKFKVESGVLGAGDLEYNIQDGTRQVLLASILFEELLGGRSLLYMENLSLSGLLLPDTQLWAKTGGLTGARVEGHRMEFIQALGETAVYSTELVATGVTPKGDSRIIEARLQVESFTTTDPNGDTGIFFSADVGPIASSRGVGLQLRSPNQVFLFSTSSNTEVQAFNFNWSDGETHSYRLICDVDTNTVSLVIDDTFVGLVAWTDFGVSSTATRSAIGFASPQATAQVTWWDYSTIALPPLTARRTLGVWLGGDKTNINNWELPRTDALNVPNSDLAAVIEEMDWRNWTQIRIHRDPAWGVTILRPDLPPPPYFTGDFGPQFTQPSAGWINVEYRDLPPRDSDISLGFVRFGALENQSITQIRMSEVRYRIFKYASEDIVMPNHMVLNQYNVITSGEIKKDVTVETWQILSKTQRVIVVSDAHVYAERVFNVQWVNTLGDTVTYYPGSFEFDATTQTITLTTELILGFVPESDEPTPEDPNVNWPNLDVVGPGAFDPNNDTETSNLNDPPNRRFLVTVNFAPGKPLTNTYLCSQPLLDGNTLINEGTPYYTKNQVGKDPINLAWGSRINDPNDTLNNDPDFILNDVFKYLEPKKDPEVIYENISFCEVSEGETCRLSPFCDDTLPGCPGSLDPNGNLGGIGNGLMEMSFSGLAFTETEPITFSDGPSGPFGQFVSGDFLEASGGDAPPGGYLQGAILFTPLGPNSPVTPGTDGTVGWSVFGQLYDTVTQTTTILYFGTNTP